MITGIETEYKVMDVVAVACAVHRMQGFVKKINIMYRSEDEKNKQPNVTYLYNHFCNNNLFPIQACDIEDAEAIVEYLKGLAFKCFERKLTEFENNVLRFVNCDTVGKDQLGIAASLPNVYHSKLIADQWAEREFELGRTSNFVGTLKSRGVFSLKVENIRYIAKTFSSLISCSESNANIVKFFSNNTSNLEKVSAGSYIIVTGYVKSHSISTYTGFKETMLNRIKIQQK